MGVNGPDTIFVLIAALQQPAFCYTRQNTFEVETDRYFYPLQRRRRGVECACWSQDHKTRTTKPANNLILCILMCCSLIQVGEAWKQPPILPSPSGFHSLVTLLIMQKSAYAAPSFKAELVISEINISGQENDQVN